MHMDHSGMDHGGAAGTSDHGGEHGAGHGSHSAADVWTLTGPPTNHGFYLLGETAFLLVHIPMFMIPHDEQVFLQVSFSGQGKQTPGELYLAARRANPDQLFTLKTTEIVLHDLEPADASRSVLRKFAARIYVGDFLKGGTPLPGAEHVIVTVEQVFHLGKIQDNAASRDLSYFAFRAGDDTYLIHSLAQPPDFDQILLAQISGQPGGMQTGHAGTLSIPGRANSADSRLLPGEQVKGSINGVAVEVTPKNELIMDTEGFMQGLKQQMPPMASPLETGQPVNTLPIQFQWHNGAWKDLFDKHVAFIQMDMKRALAADRLIVYLSCPISTRGGGHSITNVEIAEFTARRLLSQWGSRFWILDPTNYQMESQQGLGLIRMHAKNLEPPLSDAAVDELISDQPLLGGDYLRMWTRVLVEDDVSDPTLQNLGGRLSGFYFLGPSDVHAFFQQNGAENVTSGVETYFAQKIASDPRFHAYFSLPLVDEQLTPLNLSEEEEIKKVQERQREFFRYYAFKASAGFSRGSHDEWNIWQLLNKARFSSKKLGIGSQIPGYFEGAQIDLAASETAISAGYASPLEKLAVLPATAPMTEHVHLLASHTSDGA